MQPAFKFMMGLFDRQVEAAIVIQVIYSRTTLVIILGSIRAAQQHDRQIVILEF
jgi:hypothetical protein